MSAKFGGEMIDDGIVSADLTGTIKEVTVSEGTVRRARAVIVATGSGRQQVRRERDGAQQPRLVAISPRNRAA
ncbi:hypothetical protein ACFCZ1_23835 [Streptomyces sp. NPDC056224]|uniref:hypothetical protein n=1 Tax=Streptomyces sp. NPDC056224 TaxID=3345750 RepID=UPI0035D8F057